MTRNGQGQKDLLERVRARLPEIESAVAARVLSIDPPGEATDPDYLRSIREAVPVAIEYVLTAVGTPASRTPAIPPALMVQARLAARNSVDLATVQRRCVAGKEIVAYFLLDELERSSSPVANSKVIMASVSAALDRLLLQIAEEFALELSRTAKTSSEHLTFRIQRLLDGEILDLSDLNYDLGAYHLGMVASGVGAAQAIQELARFANSRALIVRASADLIWGWAGASRALERTTMEHYVSSHWPDGVPVALGEAAPGSAGWRLTHRQAQAAWSILARRRGRTLWYADVALEASLLRDDLLQAFLRQSYLTTLSEDQDGEVLTTTLQAFFATERHVSSTAAALGVKRHTVTSRLRRIEGRLGKPIGRCASQLELALLLDHLDVP